MIDRPNPAAPVQLSDSVPQYCIECTAYQAGTEINMVMVLRDEVTGVYVWSESFRLNLDNWFEAQQRIIRRIATALNVQLSAERLMRLAGEPDVSLDIYDRWLRGQSLMAKFDPESWQRAVAIFRDAIRENPSFSPSYSSLVQMNNIEHLVYPGVLPEFRQGEGDAGLAKTAVQLDPVDSRAHLSCGWSMCGLPLRRSGPHMELACELNDNDPWTSLSSRALLRFLRIDRAGAALVRAVAGAFAGATTSGMGLPRHPPLRLWRLCWRPRCHRSCARCHHILPAWRAAHCSISGSRPRRGKRRSASLTEYVRSGWDLPRRPMKP